MTSTGWGFFRSVCTMFFSLLLRRSLIILQRQFTAKAMGSKDQRSLVLSRVLALITHLDCDLHRPLFQSSDLQTHREWGNSKLWNFPSLVSLSSFLSTLCFARSLLVSPTPVSRAWLSDFVPVCVCVMFFLSSVVVFVFSRVSSC